MQDDEAVDRRAAKLSALLRATDVPAPAMAFPAERIARTRRRARLRAQLAAAAVLLVLAAASVQPVRAWIAVTARHFFLGAPKAAASGAPAAAVPAPEPEVPVPSNAVSFVPRTGAFVIELATRQQAGTLVLARVGGSEASAVILGDPGDAEFLVQPGGLRIGNRAAAQADYFVRVPPGVSRITVRIGREPARPLEVSREHDVLVPIGPRADRPE